MMGHEHLFCSGANTHPVTCHATRQGENLRIMLINKDPDESHKVELQLAPLPASAIQNCEIYSLNSETNPNNAASINGVSVDASGYMAAVSPRPHTVEQGTLSVAVPACSVLVVSIPATL
jgi:alpha-L-arabinofuranosidase